LALFARKGLKAENDSFNNRLIDLDRKSHNVNVTKYLNKIFDVHVCYCVTWFNTFGKEQVKSVTWYLCCITRCLMDPIGSQFSRSTFAITNIVCYSKCEQINCLGKRCFETGTGSAFSAAKSARGVAGVFFHIRFLFFAQSLIWHKCMSCQGKFIVSKVEPG